MSKKASIITAFNYLKLANEYFLDFIRENKGGIGEQIIKKYIKKIEWIYFDFISIPQFTEEVRNGLRGEWQSDALLIPAINEKIELLNPSQRETIESIIDAMISGEEIVLSKIKKQYLISHPISFNISVSRLVDSIRLIFYIDIWQVK